MPIGKFIILEIVIKQLKFYGFKHITISVGHQANLIKAFFGNGSKYKISIDYSLEKKPLGTMGPLKIIKDLPQNFLVLNGDVLTDLNFNIISRIALGFLHRRKSACLSFCFVTMRCDFF